ncbi:MAG: hypothetical protein NVS3B20_23800 [Polyangiales bacterium]
MAVSLGAPATLRWIAGLAVNIGFTKVGFPLALVILGSFFACAGKEAFATGGLFGATGATGATAVDVGELLTSGAALGAGVVPTPPVVDAAKA